MKRLTKGTNVLVTGGTGFVGGHLVEELLRLKTNVVSTYIVSEPNSYFMRSHFEKQATLVHQDIRDTEGMKYLVNRFNIEYIFHLAAQPIVEVAYLDPMQTLSANIIGTASVLEAARLNNKVRGIIVASSDKAYGKHGKKKYVEEDELRGNHPYEMSKSATDLLSTMYAKTYGLPVVVTRFGNIYGEGDLNFSRIIPGLIEAVLHKKTLVLRGDGSYVRDYLYVKDVAQGYIKLIENLPSVIGEAYNFGSTDTLTVLEVIKTFEKMLKLKINFKVTNSATNEIPYQSLDFHKIEKAIGWKPEFTLRGTAKKIVRWYKQVL